MCFSLKNFSPDKLMHTEQTPKSSPMQSELCDSMSEIPEVFNVPNNDMSVFAVNKTRENNQDVKVYIRCAYEAKDGSKQQCIKILQPDQTSLALNKQLSNDCTSMDLYAAQYIFDNQDCNNRTVFERMCRPYLDKIIELETNSNIVDSELFHPIFVTFGQTNIGKTRTIIGNVDDTDGNGLDGILIQFVSELFDFFQSQNKECKIKICGLEEYGEAINTLKLYDLFATMKNNKTFEEVIGSPPSKSRITKPSFIDITDIMHLEQLMRSGCESIHCGLYDSKIVSCGHVLFQLKINDKYVLSFFDMAGYNPKYKLNNNVIPSNLTLNQFIEMLWHHHNSNDNDNLSMYIPTQSVGLIPNLQNILMQNDDIVFLLHISNHIKDIEHTLKALEIAKMFPNTQRFKPMNDAVNKTLIELEAHALDDIESMDMSVTTMGDTSSMMQEDVSETIVQKKDLLFSPAPAIRLRKSHRASIGLLNNVRQNIDKLPIKSRRQISSMPLEILQLKKSKANSAKTFLVPLGFSTFDSFVVERENESDENEQNKLELHLKTNKSKFYIIIDDLRKFKDWVQTDIGMNVDNVPKINYNDAVCEDEGTGSDALEFDYSFKAKPLFLLSVFLNFISFFILCSIDYVDVQISFFEPMQKLMDKVSGQIEIIQDRNHEHQYQHHEMISLFAELDGITNYCHEYVSSVECSPEEEEEQADLFGFCQTFLNTDHSCPIDLLSI